MSLFAYFPCATCLYKKAKPPTFVLLVHEVYAYREGTGCPFPDYKYSRA